MGWLRRIPILTFALMAAVLCLTCAESYAGSRWNFHRGGTRRKPWNYALGVGPRFAYKYNRQRVLSSPPESLQAELQLQLWYRSKIGFYLLFAKGVGLAESQYIGGGIKLPLLAFEGDEGSAITGLKLNLIGDAVSFSYPAPTPPEDYPATGIALRYGTGLQLDVGSSRFYVDATMLVSYINENFFIFPFFGLGFRF